MLPAMRSLARGLVPFAALTLTALASAQQRKPCFVTVVDADDRPLAHAEVTLVEVGPVGAGPRDVVRAFTDARGRARPDVLLGRLYSASAMADAAADGSRLVSEPTDRGACGIVLELVAMHRATPRQLRIAGSVAMQEHWSRGLHVLGPDGRSTAVLPVDAEGMTTLPPSPWGPLMLGIHDGNGALLEAVRIEAHVPAPTIAFPQRTMLTLQVTDADGKPAGGASAGVVRAARRATDSLFADTATFPCSVLARADASGILEVPLGPLEAGRHGSGWLRLESACCGVRYVPANEAAGQPIASPLPVQLGSPSTATGALAGVLANERPTARLQLTLSHQQTRQTSSITLPFDVDITGNEMRAVLPSGITGHQLTIHLMPDDAAAMPRIVMLAPGRGDLASLPNVDLAKLRRFPLRLVDANGDPASSAQILVAPIPDPVDWPLRHRGLVIADLAGRAEILVGDGDWGVYMVHGKDQAWQFLGSDHPSGDFDVKLEAIPLMTMRVLDADGKPVRGAAVEPLPNMMGSLNLGLGERAKRARDAIIGECADRLATQARSNRAGQLAVPVQAWVDWRRTFRARAGERVSAPFAIQPGVDLGDVVVP